MSEWVTGQRRKEQIMNVSQEKNTAASFRPETNKMELE